MAFIALIVFNPRLPTLKGGGKPLDTIDIKPFNVNTDSSGVTIRILMAVFTKIA
jgi:hypothetical protein